MSNTVEGGFRLVRLAGTLLLCMLAALAVLGAGIAAAPVAATADMTCVGDCNNNRVVTVDELVTAVQIALASRAVDDCLAGDPDLNRSVTVNELVEAVNSLLNGCLGGPTPVVSGTVTAATSTRTADATPGGPTSTPNPAGSPTATGSAGTSGSPTSTPNPAGSPTATGGNGTPGSPTSTPNPAGSPTATGSAGTAGSATSTPNSIGTPTPTPAGGTPGATLTASPVNTPPGTSDEKLPRLVGAASASNTAIIVQFSKQMSDSVKNPGNYVITQENVNPEAGHLIVTAADFFNGDPYSVKLTTMSQNEVTYRLRVVNVRDVLNNPLAQIQVVGGVIVDSSSAVFPGAGPSCGPRTCSNGSSGVGGMGICSSDADCACPADAPADCTTVNACADRCELRDSDGDGVPDNVEQLGRVVTVHNTDGTTTTREVTADPGLKDTDGDGLDDKTELQIGTDPRRADTDGDGLSDFEEYNVIYSDPTNQDTDGDGIDDKLEVEFFKTDALLADSDGDGYSDAQELFEMNRDPRIADLPAPDFSVGEVRLQIYEQFTYTDENGQTHTEDSSTQTSLMTSEQHSSGSQEDIGGGFSITEGLVPAMQPPDPEVETTVFTGMFNASMQTTHESNTDAEQAFQNSLDKASAISTDSAVMRQITGARMDVTVTLENKGDVAFTLSNMELTALTTDPQDPSRLTPVATLLPDSQQQSGNAATFAVGPGQTRGPIVFSNREVFPNLVEDLMKAPRGLVFKVANYDLTTGDGRNFAFGLQTVHERTVSLVIDFGDGTVKQSSAITAAVLNRPRNELRCAPGGDHPDQGCASDDDCGTSRPCQGGHLIGGLSEYTGTGVSAGIPLDFVLGDVLHMRRSTPPVILAGNGGRSLTSAQGDDIQVVPVGVSNLAPNTVVVAPGRNGVLDTVPATQTIQSPDVTADNVSSQGATILAGPDGVADTVACPQNHCIQDASLHCLNSGDCQDSSGIFHACIHPTFCQDIQVVSPGTRNLPSDTIVVAASAALGNGLLSTRPSGDDVLSGPDGIVAGPDGIAESVAQGDDVQLVPVGTAGLPEDTVVIAAGQNGILETPRLGDDVADVVTGYEVSRTCSFDTPAAIVAGRDKKANTAVAPGICTIAFPPHFVGEPGCTEAADCGSDPTKLPPAAPVYGACSSDAQIVDSGKSGLDDPNTAVVLPTTADGTPTLSGTSVRSVPLVSSDDAFVGPGIACTTNDDCTVVVPGNAFNIEPGPYGGSCSGPQVVVRVDQRRNGQFRRFWALLSNKTDMLQTDFGQIRVRPGDSINLAFVQDADRDGLTAPEEFLHSTSDFNRDTDGDGLDDFAEIRVGWLVGPVGQPLRRVFPDPTKIDSDGDGLRDKEEKDLRRLQCACDAKGPKTLLGNGSLLRGQPVDDTHPDNGALPCSSDAQCGVGSTCRDTARCTTADYAGGHECPPCDSDPSLHRSDPRLKDTDGDGVTDADEVFGYRTGAGIVSPPTAGPPFDRMPPPGESRPLYTYLTVLAGPDGVADTVACPDNYCVENATRTCTGGSHSGDSCESDSDCPGGTCTLHVTGTCTGGTNPGALCVSNSDCSGGGTCTFAPPCQTDGDCASHQCLHRRECDDVQVVAPGSGGLAPNTVVVAPGIYRAVDPFLPQPIEDVCAFPPYMPATGSCPDRAIGSNFIDAFCLKDPANTICTKANHSCVDSDNNDEGPCIVYDEAAGSQVANGGLVVGLSSAVLDDVQVVPYLQSVTEFKGSSTVPKQPRCVDGSEFNDQGIYGLAHRFIMCSIVKPGPNGRIDSVAKRVADVTASPFANGDIDNLLVPDGSGQKIEVTDPLNPDTDGDEIADGIERLLGASPNDPEDTGVPADRDGDGLTDNIERAGWMVTVAGMATPRHVVPNLYVPDTDGDGLPDYAEYHMPCHDDVTKECRTDPASADTDGDGLSDFDELSAAQIAVLEKYNGFFRGYHFDGSASKKYGTDPNNRDTDFDHLSDHDELLVPFHLTVPGENGPRTVFTDPLQPDTDHDGLADNVEEARTPPTDPTDPDTDGDGRLDGAEVNTDHTNPLIKDKVVTVTYRGAQLQTTAVGPVVWFWNLYVQHPPNMSFPNAMNFPGEALSQVPDNTKTTGEECSIVGAAIPPGTNFGKDPACSIGCLFKNPVIVPINKPTTFTLQEGEGFLLNGEIAQVATCSPSYHLYQRFAESFSYDDVSGFTTKTLAFQNTQDGYTAGATVLVEISSK